MRGRCNRYQNFINLKPKCHISGSIIAYIMHIQVMRLFSAEIQETSIATNRILFYLN